MVDTGDNTVTNGAKNILAKKYGPLPFGAWLVVIAVTAYVARRLVKGQQAAKDAEANLSPEGYVVDSQGTEFPSIYKGTGGGVYPGVGSVYGAGSSGSTVTPVTETSNEPWLRRAAEKLQAAGMWDPVFVQSALGKYISGADLNQREQAVVNQAIQVEGQPTKNVVNSSASQYTTANVVRFIRPTGKAGEFAEYSDGSVRWLGDADSQNAAKADAYRRGIDPTAVVLPITDPIWKQADVYQSQSQYYLWAERWANYVDPNQYKSREDIYGNDTQTRSTIDTLWNRSLSAIRALGAPASGLGYTNSKPRQYDDAAYTAAFGTSVRGSTNA